MLVQVLEIHRAENAGYPSLFISVFIRPRPVLYLEVWSHFATSKNPGDLAI
jgi:hypothetical protein